MFKRSRVAGFALFLSLALVPAGAGSVRAGRQDSPAATPPAPETRSLPLLESILNQELGKRFGPAAKWDILVTATDEQRMAGHLPKIEIRGNNLKLPDGLVISLVQITLAGVDVDIQNGVLQRSGEATLLLRIRPDDMAQMIEKKSKGKLRGVRIDADSGKFRTRGKVRVAFFSIPLIRLSHPEIRGNAVYAHTYSMKVMGLNATKQLRKMEAKINPVVDLDELAQPLQLKKLGAEDGDLVLEVSLDLAAPLRSLEEIGKWRERQRERGRKRGPKEG
jgi:hypothetical protein